MKNLDQILSEITPVLNSVEADRQEYFRKRGNCIWFVVLPLLCFAGILTFHFFPQGLFALIPALFISGIAYHFMAGKYKQSFAENYKTCVVSRLVHEIDPNLQYNISAGIEMNAFVASELFRTHPDRYHTEDLIHGVYGETGFQLAEVNAKEKRETTDTDGKRKTTYVTIFNGLILVADFHKHFQGRTFIFPDVAEKALGGLGRTLQKMGGRHDTELIQLEDVEFEREFSVHSSDQIESRYILSPAMMRRLIELKSKFGKDVRLAFKDSNVILAVPHPKPYLEPNIRAPATDPGQIESMLREVSHFIEIIEELDLNTRIWTKQ